jgi:hypothetical protein
VGLDGRYRFRKQYAIRYLCDKCQPRYEAALAMELPDFPTYRAWIQGAPVIDTLPDRLVRQNERGRPKLR